MFPTLSNYIVPRTYSGAKRSIDIRPININPVVIIRYNILVPVPNLVLRSSTDFRL